jgi:tripartite-type tricarboxylate transporter receptor subunit TctC
MKTFIRRLAALLTLGLACAVQAQEFPSRTIRIIVPFAPGGQTDADARAYAARMAETLGRPVIVDNKPGAQGLLGVQELLRSPADGHTLMVASTSTICSLPSMYKEAQWDGKSAFTPVLQMYRLNVILHARPDAPFRSVGELVAYGKANPGKLTFGSVSLAHQIYGELFASAAGVPMLHVPFKGSSDAVRGLLGGEIDLLWDNAFSAAPLIAAGKSRGIVVTGARRGPGTPDVPTAEESGIRGLDIYGWTGMFAPRGVPPAVLQKLADATARAFRTPEVQKVHSIGGSAEPTGLGPDAFAQVVRQDCAWWEGTLRRMQHLIPKQ